MTNLVNESIESVTGAPKAMLSTPGLGTNSRDAKIRIQDLTKTFDSRGKTIQAIDTLNLDIAAGSFFVIVGPSGCGKTTLLRMLAGLEKPSSGRIEIDQDQTDRPTNSMIFQGDSIFPWMTVWRNAAYGLQMRGVPKEQIRDTVGYYLDKTGLTPFANSYPHQLSGGMRQRVSIARAFSNDPEILLMDEPFSALDEQNKTLLQGELLKIWDETKKTVVFITHSVDEAVTLGDRVMIMSSRPGQVKDLIDIPFERPRDVLHLRKEPEYGEIVYRIWGSLRAEVDAAARLQSGNGRGKK
ncbi:ABC transporter ATP-binding protein [Arthrobacter globiformis]|uniref:ABC transporter ATP-binding protein n=1 Tax=Arthrobacter globiformis TaxID=1665 RepID=UPI0027935FB2|nr:ABC transporter ATP-binding protein [Arthrobacter globiformis]MDQ0616665.1 NitT/TauT family transport system ATP-binding protein [Arthrobacter globiformis]